jgi:hypothetical protein
MRVINSFMVFGFISRLLVNPVSGNDLMGFDAFFSQREFFKPEGQPLYTSDIVDAPKVIMTFINGIYHSEEEWQRITKMIQEMFQCPILPIYNPSTGWWVRDATGAASDLIRRPVDSQMASSLAEHFRLALSTVGPRGM